MFGDDLPDDCLIVILRFLKEIEIIRVASSSKNSWGFSIVARSDRLWENKFKNCIGVTEIDDRRLKIVESQNTIYDKYLMLRRQERIYRIENPPLPYVPEGSASYKTVTTILGDKTVGKTCLAITYSNGGNCFPDDWVPNIFDDYEATILFDNKHVLSQIHDSSGNVECMSDYRLKTTTAYIMCFDVNKPSTFENVKTKWLPKLNKICPSVPIILCGLKPDIRDDCQTMNGELLMERMRKSVRPSDGEKTAEEVKSIFGYYEISSKYCKIREVFNASITAAFQNLEKFEKKRRKKEKKKKKGKGGCCVM